MKPLTAPNSPRRTPLRGAAAADWHDRAGRLFSEFEPQAKRMIRRAFRGAFGPDELDDIYAGAWVGVLRALADRHGELNDAEVRSYVLTAVANQAGKELRRRHRKPTAPLELVGGVPDHRDGPEERVASSEQSLVARDVLASLPPRRRAVMLLRYGWGLDPAQICGLITGLSPRAYRKEITRGVDEVTTRMKAVETGEWCAEREPLLKDFVAGVADDEQTRQARAHLSHCRACSNFVARLSGHLHDIGGGVATVAAIDGIDGHLALGDRVLELGERATGAFARSGAGGAADGGGALASSGGARGAGAAGAGVLAKLAGAGAAGKLAIACVGGGVAVTACIAAGVAPLGSSPDERAQPQRTTAEARPTRKPAKPLEVEVLPTQVGHEATPATEPASAESSSNQVSSEPQPSQPKPEPAEPEVAATAPPEQQEFSAEAAAVAPPAPAATSGSSGGGSSTASAGGAVEQTESSAANQEFGP